MPYLISIGPLSFEPPSTCTFCSTTLPDSIQCLLDSYYSDSGLVAVHWLLKWMRDYKLLDPISFLVTVRPVAIEGKDDISKEFEEFVPTWK